MNLKKKDSIIERIIAVILTMVMVVYALPLSLISLQVHAEEEQSDENRTVSIVKEVNESLGITVDFHNGSYDGVGHSLVGITDSDNGATCGKYTFSYTVSGESAQPEAPIATDAGTYMIIVTAQETDNVSAQEIGVATGEAVITKKQTTNEGDFIYFEETNSEYILNANNSVVSNSQIKYANMPNIENDSATVTYSIDANSISNGFTYNDSNQRVEISDYNAVSEAILDAENNNQNLTVTLTAQKSEGTNYGADTASKEITVKFADEEASDENTYTITGESVTFATKDGANVTWYKKGAEIMPNSGYEILVGELEPTNFQSALYISNQNGISVDNVYFKNSAGDILSPINIQLMIDNESPVIKSCELSQSIKNIVLKNTSTKTKYYNPKKRIGQDYAKCMLTITGSDAYSGVSKFQVEYILDGESVTKEAAAVVSGDSGYICVIDLTEEVRDGSDYKQINSTLKLKAVDYLDNISADYDVQEDGKTVSVAVDTTKPTVDITYTAVDGSKNIHYLDNDNNEIAGGSFKDASKAYCNGDIKSTITINEANFQEGAELEDGSKVHDVGIKLVKTDINGNVTSTEYLPQGTAPKYSDCNTENFSWTDNGTKHSFDITYYTDAVYELQVEYVKDIADNETVINATDSAVACENGIYKSKPIIIAKTEPKINAEYTSADPVQTLSGIEYYATSRAVTVTVTDMAFSPERVESTIAAVDVLGNTVEGASLPDFKNIQWSQPDAANAPNTWTAAFNYNVDADYLAQFGYLSLSGKEFTTSESKFVIDTNAPQDIKITYSEPVTSFVDTLLSKITFGFYQSSKKALKVTIEGSDLTSGIETFDIDFTTTGSAAATTVTPLPSDLKVGIDGNVKSGTAGFIKNIQQELESDAETVKLSFTVPANLKGMFSATATDKSGNIYDSDASKDDVQKYSDQGVVVDDIAPNVNIAYSGNCVKKVKVDNDGKITDDVVSPVDANTRFIYGGEVTATITAVEANFYEDMEITITRDGQDIISDATTAQNGDGCAIGEWTPKISAEGAPNDTYTKLIKLSADGEYVITVKYADKSGNVMTYSSAGENITNKTNETYTSNVISIDTTAPEYVVTYDNNDCKNNSGDREYYAADRKATITVTDHNFRPNEVVVMGTAVDSSGNSVAAFSCPDLTQWTNWTHDASAPNKWTATVDFNQSANYTLEFDYTDAAGHNITAKDGQNKYKAEFTVDKDKPVISTYTLSDSLKNIMLTDSAGNSEKYIKYYNPRKQITVGGNPEDNRCVLTIKGTDKTSSVSKFQVKYKLNGNDVTTEVTAQAVGTGSYTGILDLTDKIDSASEYRQINSTLEITAIDYASNQSDSKIVQENVSGTDKNVNVAIDTESPTVDISYRPIGGSTKTRYVDINNNVVDSFVNASKAYYNGTVRATIKITESGFYEGMKVDGKTVHDVGIKLVKTESDGTVTSTEYIPKGSTYKYDECSNSAVEFEWTNSDDGKIHTLDIDYDVEAEYKLYVEYAKDIAENETIINTTDSAVIHENGKYESKPIIIDTSEPEINVEYNPVNPVQTVNGIEYYATSRAVTVTVTDSAFNVDGLEVTNIALDVLGNPLSGGSMPDFKNAANWKQLDAVNAPYTWTAIFEYSTDANYTAAFGYSDVAGNRVATDETKFTVDKKTPENIKITYSSPVTSFVDTLLSGITFGFYQSKKNPLVVTIEGTDLTSGIETFGIDFTATGSAAATTVTLPNDLKVGTDGKVVSGTPGFISNIQRVSGSDKKTTKLTFTVPANLKGMFSVTATDYSGNTYDNDSAKDGVQKYSNQGVVVDDINPDVNIAYSGNLVKKVEGDSASQITRQDVSTVDANTRFVYDGEVTAIITAVEANFYEDMEITVMRDGQKVISGTKPVSGEGCEIGEWTPKITAEGAPNDTYSKVIKLSSDGDYVITITYTDKSGNVMTYSSTAESKNNTTDKTYQSNIITVDTTAPEYTVTYDNNDCKNKSGEREYYAANRKATITVTDRNFRPNEISFAVTAKDVSGNDVQGFTYSKLTAWTDWIKDSSNPDKWTATVDFNVDANYTVDFDYTDIAGNNIADKENQEKYKAEFTVDKVKPSDVKVSYSKNEVGGKIWDNLLSGFTFGFYNPDKNAPLTVTLEAKDITSSVEYFALNVESSGAKAATDVKLPSNLQLSADGSMKSGDKGFIGDVNSSKDNSGLIKLTFTVPAQFRGAFSVSAVDMSGNNSDKYEDKEIVIVDTINPEVSISYAGDLVDTVEKDTDIISRQTVTGDAVNENTRYVYNDTVVATIKASEANFYEDMIITVTRNGEVIASTSEAVSTTGCIINGWLVDENTDDKSAATDFRKAISLNEDGDYVITVTYLDKSGNEMNYTSDEYVGKSGESASYTSNIITIDTTEPEYTIIYNNNTKNKNVRNKVKGRSYYDKKRTATITVTDRNFRPNEVNFNVEAKDVSGKEISNFISPELNMVNKDNKWIEWECLDEQNAPDTWTAKVDFDVDANYTVDFDYTDIAGNKAVNVNTNDYKSNPYTEMFTVDRQNPDTPEIKYDTPIIEKVLSALTFGFYKEKVNVTISASNDVAGIDYFEWQYTKQNGASAKNKETTGINEVSSLKYSNGGKDAEISFSIDASARGYISAKAYTRSSIDGSRKESFDDANSIKVVDNISPVVNISYTPAFENTQVQFTDGNLNTVGDFASASQAFYNGTVVAHITVDEANFFDGDMSKDGVMHNIGILMKKTDDNGNVSYFEFRPNGSPAYEFSNTDAYANHVEEYNNREFYSVNWNQADADKRTFDIYYNNDGDYELYFEYTDLSENQASIVNNGDGITGIKTYHSKPVTVDKTSPVINVTYDNTNVINNIDGRSYFDDIRTATIVVNEHNFRAEDIAAAVDAVNVTGDNVPVFDYREYLSRRSSWVQEGNVYTAIITYSADANYTFDIDYEDLAHNKIYDYAPDLFTVDKTTPENLQVSYSTNIIEVVLEKITFGFYNAQMTVTISADDTTSGVWRYDYSYINSEGVSSINRELLDVAISNAGITYDGARATTRFTVPREELNANNQFNGTVQFTAYDRADLSTMMADNERIVLDNIAPNATITFNQETSQVGDVKYYSGDIAATIDIEEANFYSEDVKVIVTRNGAEYPVNVNWRDDSVDRHTGTFTLSEDGDYKVAVTYTDRSDNKMNDYESGQMTIDTKAPVITSYNVMNQSANNGDTISLAISVKDKNIDVSRFKPVLKSVKKNEVAENQYKYETLDEDIKSKARFEEFSDGDGEKVYKYTIDNIEGDDGYYVLTCEAEDYANHKVTNIQSESGEPLANDKLEFSVNRDGSVFWIETHHKNKYTEETFENQLDGNYANDKDSIEVILHEVNVDKVNDSQATENATSFTLNDGNSSEDVVLKTMEEDSSNYNYVKNVNVGEGGWYESTYTLNKNNFDHDGRYSINVVTHDTAKNENLNKNPNKNNNKTGIIEFTLDETNPDISSDLNSNDRIKAAEYEVEFWLTDSNIDPDSIAVKLNGKSIEPKEVGTDSFTFTMANGYNQNFEINAKDLAGNSAEPYKIEGVTVTTNILLLWYANTALFWGSIGGFVVVAGGITAAIVIRRRRRAIIDEE